MLNFKKAKPEATYLGLPMSRAQSKKESCLLNHKMEIKLKGLKAKALSYIGITVTIKAAPKAIPNYAMSVVYLPKLCTETDHLLCNFWWAKQDGARYLHLKS